MYRCPRCNVELSPEAQFCPRCGFNQTNARMQKVTPQQTATSNASAAPTPAPATPSISPGMPTALPPTPMTPPPAPHRSYQPEVRRVIPQRASLNVQAASPTMSAFPPIQTTNQQNQPVGPGNIQQENNVAPPANSVLPVRTNTPPGSKKGVPAVPAHLTTLESEERAYKTHSSVDQSRPHDDQAHPHGGERPEEAELEDRQLQTNEEDVAQAKGLSLTKRYMSEQETKYQPAFSPGSSPGLSLEAPARPPLLEGNAQGLSGRPALQPALTMASAMVRSPEMPLGFETFTGEGSESLNATSKAAEHWRQSWRDRQHAEAGPAIGITRGQAAVPEPLMAMQHSIARMRAIIIPKNSREHKGKNFAFWLTLILLLCIIVGLSGYVISTYAAPAQSSAQVSSAASVAPTLTMQKARTSTIAAGQVVHVQGMYFGPDHTITFTLATTPLSASSVKSNNKGTFDASLSIPATWLAGSYALQAQDNQSGLHAFLNLQILPGTPTMSNNSPLVLTTNEQPLATSGLAFKTIMGKSTLASQRITLTNSGNTPVQWSVSTIAENNLNWLLINDGKTGGTLAISGTDSMGISVSAIGLKSSTKPYIGSVIFTVNSTQAIVPVSLTVQDTVLEVVVNPNPVIAYLQGGGTCQATTLTLINLSSQVVTWNANPYDVDKSHIHLDGQTSEQGTLDPVGSPANTKVVHITCIGAQVGEKLYHISVYYNGVAVNVPVSVRYS